MGTRRALPHTIMGIEQSPVSFATAVFSVCAMALLLFSALTHTPDRSPVSLLLALAVQSLLFALVAVLLGRRLPDWLAVLVAGLAVAVLCVLSVFSRSVPGIISNGIFFPGIGVFLVWFFPTIWARMLLYSGLVAYVTITFAKQMTDFAPVIVGLAVETVVLTEVIIVLRERLQRAATTDSLTGADNLRGIQSKGHREVALSSRDHRPFSLIVIDLDGLKEINDGLGHAAGDEMLIAAVDGIRAGLRASDSVGRTGGDEFLILLPGTTGPEAETAGIRLREASAVSWSFGVAEYVKGDDFATMCSRADRELYRQKDGRRAT